MQIVSIGSWCGPEAGDEIQARCGRAAGLAAVVLAAACVPGPGPAAKPDGPFLIKHGWDAPSPRFVHDHVEEMERLPFDGTIISLGALSKRVQRQQPMDVGETTSALAPLRTTRFTRLRHNFALVYATPAGSFFDDYSVPASNFANLAAAAREADLEGIAYDNEEYFGPTARYPENCSGSSVARCRDQARLRGKQVMDAMRLAWPDIRVIVFLGAWVSEPRTADVLGPAMNFNDVASANQVMGSFIVGMVESTVGTRARVIDAGQLYTVRSRRQFARFRSWQKEGMARSSDLIPDSLQSQWSSTVSAGAMVYDQPWIDVGMDETVWGSTIDNALKSVDDYVMVYTERYDWWGTGWPTTRVPVGWVEATRQAR